MIIRLPSSACPRDATTTREIRLQSLSYRDIELMMRSCCIGALTDVGEVFGAERRVAGELVELHGPSQLPHHVHNVLHDASDEGDV